MAIRVPQHQICRLQNAVPTVTAFAPDPWLPPTAADRVRLFRLAWDTCCSAFASRQILYERFFQGDAYRNVVLLNSLYDKEPATSFVREFLEGA